MTNALRPLRQGTLHARKQPRKTDLLNAVEYHAARPARPKWTERFTGPTRLPSYDPKKGAMTLLREPLIHFMGLGVLVFLLHRAVSAASVQSAESVIAVDAQQQRELNALFEKRQGRAPDAREARELATSWIEDELLFREALRLSLPSQDEALRDHLIARMRTLIQASAGARVASDAELRKYFEAHLTKYRKPASVSFSEYPVHSGSEAEDSARQLQTQLQAGQAVAALPTRFEKAGWPEVEARFGPEVVARLQGMPFGTWQILRSSRGLHVVKLEARQAAEEPDSLLLHDRIEADLRIEATQVHFREELARLKESFHAQAPESAFPAHDLSARVLPKGQQQ